VTVRITPASRRRHLTEARVRHGVILNALTVPFIYSLALPLLMLDAWITAYQTICFPLYGIARVVRHRHFVADRYRLPYLSLLEKVHCAYCGYANGVLTYAREVAAVTEQYWCPIKHDEPIPDPHEHYQLFLNYGDGAAYRRRLPGLRARLHEPHVHR
jgi:hypothetical protein